MESGGGGEGLVKYVMVDRKEPSISGIMTFFLDGNKKIVFSLKVIVTFPKIVISLPQMHFSTNTLCSAYRKFCKETMGTF